MNGTLRAGLAAAGLAFAGWVTIGVYRAGSEVPPPESYPVTKLTAGHAEGRRIDGKASWSLDYRKLTASADNTLATLEDVEHGELYKHGSPFMRMIAKHVVVNTISNDFVVTGPIELIENDGKHARRLTSNGATYSGADQVLSLNNTAKIETDGVHATVRTANVNFRSGDLTLGRLTGVY